VDPEEMVRREIVEGQREREVEISATLAAIGVGTYYRTLVEYGVPSEIAGALTSIFIQVSTQRYELEARR
jgi:hypothetical protein